MREYKFRGKRVDNGEWEYGDLWQSKGRIDIVDMYSCVYPVDPETVGQYAERQDRNRKDVYEGDVVIVEFFTDSRCKKLKQKAVITFYADAWCVDMSPLYPNAREGWIRCIAADDELEVIGNIYDNPELLGEVRA